ncbi:MAG TPA: hypothetical protein VGH73_26030 [Thermoanaerobaculia bacterium]|jgi:hypothetical protein
MHNLHHLQTCAARLSSTGPAETAEALEHLEIQSLAAKMETLAGCSGNWIEEELFSVPGAHASLFLVPRGGVLPLHDHPDMTVLLRVVAGRFSIRSYDWAAEPPDADPPVSRLARQVADRVVTGADPVQVLLPGQGNLHRIEALEEGAFVDVFSPYYSEADGRPCTYYREKGGEKGGEKGAVEAAGERLVRLVACSEEEAVTGSGTTAPS